MSRKEFIVVLIITFIVVIIWIIADIIHTQPSVTKDPKIDKLIEPLNPNFDESVTNQLKNII